MNITIKRIDPSLPLPEYKTDGSVAFDLYAREETIIPARGFALVPTNFIVKVPEGHVLFLASRSSTPKRKGLMVGNGIGIIDQDYCGNEDELLVVFYNVMDEDVTIERGERIAQGLLAKISKGTFHEVEVMEGTSRGGFGSTGTHEEKFDKASTESILATE